MTWDSRQTTCWGDSGTGWTMVFEGVHHLVGVHSGGNFCMSIAVATDLSKESDWVLRKMKEN